MKNVFAALHGLHGWFVRVVSSAQSPFLLAVRLYWGWQLGEDSWGKLHHLDNVTQFFTELNLPMPHQTAIFVASFEFIAGILLAVGLLSRITALGIFIDMLVAYLTADREAFSSFFSDPNKFAGADPFVFFFVALLILIVGPGKLSLDTLLERVMGKATPREAGAAAR